MIRKDFLDAFGTGRDPSLAVFGFDPAFDRPVHVGQPNIGDREVLFRMLGEILDRRWLTNNGPVVQEFERRIERMLGVKHCLAVCNATIGLQLVIMALELSGEVIVPSFTFCATAQSLAWCGVSPRFCDVDRDYHTIDIKALESLITDQTTGVLGVHLWGNACPVDKIDHVAKANGLKVIYDAAHAFGSSFGSSPIGTFGNAEVFSFHATKYINSFEGGAITTNDDALAAQLRLMCNFGFESGEVQCLGTNAKMSEIAAAMGLVSLDAMQSIEAVNKTNRRLYQQGLRDICGIGFVPITSHDNHNHQYVVIEVNQDESGLSRDHLLEVLRRENILARRYFHPGCHRIEPFATNFPDIGDRLPVTEALCKNVLALPTGTCVEPEAIEIICNVIKIALSNSIAVQERLTAIITN